MHDKIDIYCRANKGFVLPHNSYEPAQAAQDDFIETKEAFSPDSSYTPEDPVKIAALDFDGTLISGQSGSELVYYLISRKLMDWKLVLKVGWWGIRYKLRLPVEQSEVREDIFSLFTNKSTETVSKFMHEFHTKHLIRMYTQDVFNEVARLQREGYYVIIVSASFMHIVLPAAEHINADAVLATQMQHTVDGSGFTGKVDGLPVEGEQKVYSIVEFANAKFGENNWVLDCAYGDHYSDWHMLDFAVQGYAVNPDTKMEDIAKQKGWPILHWK